MLKKIKIKNFRSIKNQEIALAPFTVIYGPTASGKSSLLYSMLILKNFIENPNQTLDGFFSLGFINLSGFDACVFNHDTDKGIEIGISCEEGEYGLTLHKNKGMVYLISNLGIEIEGEIDIPYTLSKNFTFKWKEYTINWNVISSTVTPDHPTPDTLQEAHELSIKLNSIPESLRKIDIVPHKRGFFKPFYTPISTSRLPVTEDEVASIIINDPNLSPRISVDLEKILGRDFRLYTPPGTSTTYFQTTDKKSRVPGYLVNDGFGVNQIVYMLAKIHRQSVKTILIEEPEVHLHPTVIRSLVKVLCEIINEEDKQIIVTTHSEVFVSSLLSAVARKIISVENLMCYLAVKENKTTIFKPQEVQKNGQIKGGLSSFVEGELEELKTLLGFKE